MRAHLDFVVCDRGRAMTPVFAVEFDGPSHVSDVQRARDVRKNRLCARAGLPLLRIGDAEIQDHDRRTVLDHMMARTIAWRHEAPELRDELKSRFDELDESAKEAMATQGFLDPKFDVGFQFDQRHPFPGINQLCKRLWNNHGVGTMFAGSPSEWCPVTALALRWSMEGVGPHWLVSREWVVGRTDGRPPDLTALKSGDGVLHSGTTQFSMQWGLPTVTDYDWSEPATDYAERTGGMPYVFTDLPGAHAPDIAESFADYLFLREVEDWAALTSG